MLRYMTLRLISWNIGQQSEPWRVLVEDDSIDVALIQEAPPPPIGIDLDVIVDGNWQLAGWQARSFAAVIVRCSNRVEVTAEPMVKSVEAASANELAVSRPGSLAVATMSGPGLRAPIIVASIYAA